MLRWNRVIVIAAGVVLVVVTCGCSVSAEMSTPFVLKPAPQQQVSRSEESTPEDLSRETRAVHDRVAPSPVGGPSGLALFGDRPEFEQVPFENRLVTNLQRHSFTSEGLDFDPDVYGPEDLIVFASTRNSRHPDIYLKKTDGITLTQITGDPADDIQPRFSPDGEKIVFASNRGGTWDIWMINRDGTGLTQLTRDGPDEIAPAWSADGSQVVYCLWGDRSHQWEIWTLSVEQPGTRSFLAYGMFPTWSPDGGRIALQRARERGSRLFSVWTIDLVGGEARHPTEVAHSDTAACVAPRWSPDGQFLTYCSVREGRREESLNRSTPPGADIWVVDLKTGLRMKLTDSADADFNPVWATNDRIFFVSGRTGAENIWSLTTSIRDYAKGAGPDQRVSRADYEIDPDSAKE